MPKRVVVHDAIQKNYRYTLTAPMGKRFDPRFKPELTPKQMMALGVFDGVYLNDCQKEFPKDWFAKAKLAAGKPDSSLNFFKIHASQPLRVWQQKGWIYPDDPRGWFQWYARYYVGRRIPQEDDRQIRRWVGIRRHIAQIKKHCRPKDLSCHRKQRQALLHWAYDSRKI